MFKGKIRGKNNQAIVILGITEENIERAKQGDPIIVLLKDIGLPHTAVIIIVEDDFGKVRTKAIEISHKVAARDKADKLIVMYMTSTRADQLKQKPYIQTSPAMPEVKFFLYVGTDLEMINRELKDRDLISPLTGQVIVPKDPEDN